MVVNPMNFDPGSIPQPLIILCFRISQYHDHEKLHITFNSIEVVRKYKKIIKKYKKRIKNNKKRKKKNGWWNFFSFFIIIKK